MRNVHHPSSVLALLLVLASSCTKLDESNESQSRLRVSVAASDPQRKSSEAEEGVAGALATPQERFGLDLPLGPFLVRSEAVDTETAEPQEPLLYERQHDFGPLLPQDEADESAYAEPRLHLLASGTTPAPVFTFTTPASGTGRLNVRGGAGDSQIAASATHFCLTARDVVACYTKGGTAVFGPMNAESLFAPTGLTFAPGANEVFDLRAAYDHYRDRIVLLGLYSAAATVPNSHFLIAVSRSSDPREGFHTYAVSVASNDPAFRSYLAADFPYLGIGPTTIYMTAGLEVFGPHCSQTPAPAEPNPCNPWENRHQIMHVLRASRLASGLSIRASDQAQYTVPNGAAAVVHETATSELFVAFRASSNTLGLWSLRNPLSANAQWVQPADIPVQAFSEPPSAVQRPGVAGTPRISVLGTLFNSAQFRNNQLLLTSHGGRYWNGEEGWTELMSAVRLMRFNVVNYGTVQPTALTDLTIGGRDSNESQFFWYMFGGAMQNRNGDIAMGHLRSNASTYPQFRVSTWQTGDTDIRNGRVILASDTTLLGHGGPNVGVDNPGVSVDPFDDTSIYLSQVVASASSSGTTCGYTAPSACSGAAGSLCTCRNFRFAVAKMFGSTRPDLNYTSISHNVSTGSGWRNVPFSVSVRVANEGDGTMAASSGVVYLSTDATITTSDTQIGTFSVGQLTRNGTTTVNVPVIAPWTLPLGTYFVGARLDSGSVASEYSETNNTNPPGLTKPQITFVF